MAEDLQSFRILRRDDAQPRVAIDNVRRVHQLAVDFARERGLREALADRRGNLGDRDRTVEVLLAAVRQGDYGHGVSTHKRVMLVDSPVGRATATVSLPCSWGGDEHATPDDVDRVPGGVRHAGIAEGCRSPTQAGSNGTSRDWQDSAPIPRAASAACVQRGRHRRPRIHQGLMRGAGLEVRVDTAGNIIGRRNGTDPLPVIMMGSHIDSVPKGGNYDGDVGVLGAIEVATAARTRIATRHPLEFVCLPTRKAARSAARRWPARWAPTRSTSSATAA